MPPKKTGKTLLIFLKQTVFLCGAENWIRNFLNLGCSVEENQMKCHFRGKWTAKKFFSGAK